MYIKQTRNSRSRQADFHTARAKKKCLALPNYMPLLGWPEGPPIKISQWNIHA